MEKLYFDDYCDLSDFMYEVATSENSTICAVLNYEQADRLLRCLLVFDDITSGIIDISSPDMCEYDREYYVTLSNELGLYVEPVFSGEKLLENPADVYLFDGDVSSKIALKHKGIQFEISVEECQECEDCEDCSECEYDENDVKQVALRAIDLALNCLKYLYLE